MATHGRVADVPPPLVLIGGPGWLLASCYNYKKCGLRMMGRSDRRKPVSIVGIVEVELFGAGPQHNLVEDAKLACSEGPDTENRSNPLFIP